MTTRMAMPRLVRRNGKRAVSFDCQLVGTAGVEVPSATSGLAAGLGSAVIVGVLVVVMGLSCWS